MASATVSGGSATAGTSGNTAGSAKLPNTTTNPFDNDIDLSKKEGLSIWKSATEPDSSVTRLELTVQNGDKLLARFKSKCSEFRINRYIRIPTEGTGVTAVTRGGSPHNFTAWSKLLESYHSLTLEEVQAFACYNWGENDTVRAKTASFQVKTLDFETQGSELERAKMKQQYRIRSEMLFKIIQNNIPETDFELLQVESDAFTFTDNVTGDEIGDGVILLKLILDDVKPSTVIDVQDLEEKLASATLLKHGNNVQTCNREMEKIYKEIRRLKPGTYDDNRFLTQLFRALETTTNESFARTVEFIKDKWIMGDASCTVQYVISTLNNKFRNLEGSGSWNKTSEKDTKIIALATKLKDQEKKFNELQSQLKGSKGGGKTNSGSNNAAEDSSSSKPKKLKIPEWRTKNTGPMKTVDGQQWAWCPHHKSEGLFDGLYMPHPHDHAKWKEEKNEKIKAYKAAKKERRGQRNKDNSSASANTSAPNKLTLSSNLKSALTTKLGVSDADAARIIQDAISQSKE